MTLKIKEWPSPIAIIGMGISGDSVKNLLLAYGYTPEEIVTYDDRHNPGLADYTDSDLLLREKKPMTLVVSPGFPLATPWIKAAQDKGARLTSELSVAWRALSGERVIGITGSVGKSTTTALLGAALQKISPDSFVGGNIGVPLAQYAKDLIQGKRPRAPYIVLELSSFQLENFEPFFCEVGAITYLTANHLERYASQNAYYQTKWWLAQRCMRTLVLNRKGGDLFDFVSHQERLATKRRWIDGDDLWFKNFEPKGAKILGSHNQDNLAMAFAIAEEMGFAPEAYQAMLEFRGLAHRVENLGEFAGIRFVNDSKATTIESVRIAVKSVMESVAPSSRLHLLVGGKDKDLPWRELGDLRSIPNLSLIFFGACAEKAKILSALPGPTVPKLGDVFAQLKSIAKPGDTVLLSPGGTSLDEFKNFEERGREFARLVAENFS
jgi:UDP-N-acetylmuramoylalanine--D-glutamate ligase